MEILIVALRQSHVTKFIILLFLLQVGKLAILDWGKASLSHKNSQTSKEIGVDISIFLGCSMLYRHVVKHCCVFVTSSIFNFQFSLYECLPGLRLILDCAVSSHTVLTRYI